MLFYMLFHYKTFLIFIALYYVHFIHLIKDM